ncbi:MAG TPA: amino acid permease [Kineosporiaceae bacterium]|nr:amino acid permease [Kineosporiaceae bacterium]
MTTTGNLSTARASALYIGALLGPSLLLLPGLAAELAGPASILAWLLLLIVSAMLARVFTALGTRFRSAGGVAAYTEAGLGPRAGRAVAWCFLAGVICGAPIVCLIGGGYVAVLLGGGRGASLGAAAVLLVAVIALTLGGARATAAAQLVLICLLVLLVVVAVVGSAPAARTANWQPFLPHGWSSIGSATSVLMMSAVGWEAIAPLTTRLRDPRRQLPRVILIAFVVTMIFYLGLAVSTLSVLGPQAGSATPLSDLLRVAVGPAGPAIAAVAAVALTLACTNAYLTGAAALAAALRAPAGPARRAQRPAGERESRLLQIGTGAVGLIILGGAATGLLSTTQLVALPTALFLTVYLGCTAAATRILRGGTRVIAGLAFGTVAAILCFAGWALLGVLAVVLLGAILPQGADLREGSGVRPNPAPSRVPAGLGMR